jgi:fructosamine-3-kinase
MDARLRSAIGARLGAAVVRVRTLTGGSINQAWAVELGDGRSVFVKSNAHAPEDMFAAEVHGLAFLREGLVGVEGISVPEVIACDEQFLVLELIELTQGCERFNELLGRGLASLHRSGAQLRVGLERDNYIGKVPQPNDPFGPARRVAPRRLPPLRDLRPDWPSFYRDCRLAPMIERAGKRIPSALRARFDRLYARLPELCGPPEPPARLHGDLWIGNLHCDAAGRPVLIDPAVYAGHREIDLAMMRLFGGFSEQVFAAYDEVWPLADDWQRRVHLYQLYPLLVHVVLFGQSYVPAIEAALRRLE